QGMAAIATVAARRVYHDSYIEKHPHVIEERRAVLLGIEPNSFLAACEILASIDLLPELPSIKTPTLVVFGSHDQATPPDLIRAIVRAVPNAQIREITIAVTALPWRSPKRFCQHCRASSPHSGECRKASLELKARP